ncbi:saccharopine dehydrogenase NADP-binding domain-containing protein [Pseudenhygromyxa sp. WMMC2535]|uniref:saccharopine dehydrogenase family protein n=1 Tax=Pseudenhygromyxa sp. WMMC2535 TaxID=2712867 RepID=UPI001553A347|nr:saccharopine dehydrogenase NADP-binding domain-containing protein [Pseudenhygromyxa sp. WMMC2535]NVB43157.1 saccharopine dehydrogenase NADP-binding domain-containing protein [Pseudenhygromyxa sp. WMMC2535]
MTEPTVKRDHDLVLWGATGFTGALVAEYLVRNGALDELRLALAGRSRDKLEALRDQLAAIVPAAAELPLLIGDSFDRASLDAIASSTKVVCSTVGPYAKYGEAVVAACVTHGTHYCDLTGEAQFVHRMIASHHERAVLNGARIVHCCGYDSLPSDLGTYMLHRAFAERGGHVERVRFFAGESKGGASGGTIASMLHMVDEVSRDRSVLKILANPYSLYPKSEPPGRDGGDQNGVRLDRDLGMWTGPFVMAAINAKVVRRSNALLDFAYGREFRYAESMSTGRGVRGLAFAAALSVGVGVGLGLMAIGPARRLIERRLPKPGEGPDRDTREAGYFVCRLIADGVDQSGRRLQLRGRVEGTNDPGYGETAKMLGESARCLALDALDSPGGIRTPASTMGDALLERLRRAGMTFRVEG